MNGNLVNGIAEALLEADWGPNGVPVAATATATAVAQYDARIAAEAAIAFVAALPADYTAADVYAAMTTDDAEDGAA